MHDVLYCVERLINKFYKNVSCGESRTLNVGEKYHCTTGLQFNSIGLLCVGKQFKII